MTDTAALTYDFNLARKSVTGDSETLVVAGLASNWDLDRDGEKMGIDAFARSLKKYMSSNPIVLFNHKYSMPMGRTTKAEVRPDGLHVTVELPKPASGELLNIWKLVKAGVMRAFSVGGSATRKVINGVQTVIDWDLRELSIAAVGVNPGTTFSLASAQVGKAFGDPVSDLDRAHAELATIRDAGELLDRIGLRLDVMAVRERCRS